MQPSPIDRLCDLFGIVAEYHDVSGRLQRVPEETRRRLLAAMSANNSAEIDHEQGLERTLAETEAERWRRRLPPVAVALEGDADLALTLSLPAQEAGRPLRWQVDEEDGRRYGGTLLAADFPVDGRRELDGEAWIAVTASVAAPEAVGYHRLRLGPDDGSGASSAECLLVVAPRTCFRPEALEEGRRLWGLTAQLYGLRSQRNWGVGDFTDLIRLIELAAGEGADFVGLNPLHSPLTQDEEHASPYDPSSRLFLNALYLDVEAIPDFEDSRRAQQQVADESFQAELRSLRASELVDYTAVGAAKNRTLETLFDSFCRRHRGRNTARGRQFSAYRRERGELLYRYASFQVVAEYWRERGRSAWGWPAWPKEFHDCRSAAVAELVASRDERLEYFMYLQWNAERQLAAAAARAQELGMAVGVYVDLALGSRRGGADDWIHAGLHIADAHLGAPPDPFNQSGQDWGLPPLNPEAIRAVGYRPVIEMLRANMRHGGALRIDHVMWLLRSFVIPAGCSPHEGAYVRYPFDELRAILAVESRRNRCLVIGEDLGTVPDELRTGLRDIGVLGYRVLFFEKDEQGSYRQPEAYDRDVLAVVSTHDLPTLVGFWQGADIAWRSEHDLYPDDAAREQQLVGRAEDRARLLVALEKAGLWQPDAQPTESRGGPEMEDVGLRTAVHRYLARTPSLLAGVQVEDLLAAREQANLPGTTHEHPNWRRKLPLQIDSWREDADIFRLTAAMHEERPRASAEVAAPAALPAPARIPRATYRLQLNRDFGFGDAERLVPYLDALGISHVYCSPYVKAREGSTHGYDVVDHNALNPEIGDRADLERFHAALRRAGMAHILDMVPNHMAVAGREDEWWLDILENGEASSFADYFDIDWQPLKEALRGKVLLPVLGDHYGNVVDDGDLKLRFDDLEGTFSVEYFEHVFPIDPREYPRILGVHLELLRSRLPGDDLTLMQFESLVTALGNLPPRSEADASSRQVRRRDQRLLKQRLADIAKAPDIRRYIVESLRVFNGDARYPADTARLHRLLEAQAYRLAYWRVAAYDINYRRFFDINDLASLRMENEEVFEATHELVFELLSSGILEGLRIDHPDGLYDPRGYFAALQERAGMPASDTHEPEELPLYLLAEKILAGGEDLRCDWPIHGTTGYEFADLMNRFFVRPDGLEKLGRIYDDFVGQQMSYDEILYRSKRLIMQTSLASELNVLASELDRLAEEDPRTRDFGLDGLRNALLETVACFPVYRTYVVDGQVSEEDARIIDEAVDAAKSRSEAADTSVFEFLRDVLMNRSAAGRGEEAQERAARFGMRLQQFTSPVAAKGMEDTAFYRYARLLSLNEVGGNPGQPALTADALHEANVRRLSRWPHSMLASSTHDTKRSEDVRARLAVLSELADEWQQRAASWTEINARLRNPNLDSNTEYFLYQTLLGVWPLDGERLSEEGYRDLLARLGAYMNKAVKEAKQRTSWINPDETYEASLQSFVEALLDPRSNGAFMDEFLPLQQRVARLGLFNSVSQLMLKLTCPGVPDVYQGNELWRFDLVDPDNRRPVDFPRRITLLEDIRTACRAGRGGPLIEEMARSIADGRLKLFLTWRTLEVRRQYAGIFERGKYVPLRVEGDLARHVFAFARVHDGETVVIAVLRWFAALVRSAEGLLDAWRFTDTYVDLPDGDFAWSDGLTGEPLLTSAGAEARLRASVLFGPMPVALLVGTTARPVT